MLPWQYKEIKLIIFDVWLIYAYASCGWAYTCCWHFKNKCRASALPRDYDGNYFQMKLSYSPFAPIFLFLSEWLDFSCTDTLPMYLGLLHILIFNVSHYHFWLISSLLYFPPCSVFEFFALFLSTLPLPFTVEM